MARPGFHQSKRSESQVVTTIATQCSFQAAGLLDASARSQRTSGKSRETAYTSDSEHSYPPPAPARPARVAGSPTVYTAFLIVGLVFLVAINVLFIVDIELTLQRNKKHQTDEEREWGFGQILALLLLIVPLRDAWNALRVIRSRPQQQFEELFETSAQATSVVEKLAELVTAGADPGKQIPGKFANCLQLAAYHGKRDLVAFLLDDEKRRVHVDDPGTTTNMYRVKWCESFSGEDYRTALQAAAARGHDKVVEQLLDRGADVNIEGEWYRTTNRR